MRSMMIAAAAFALTMPGLAQAAEPQCLTPGEFSALAGYALPSAIAGATKRCQSTLSSGAFLPSQGAALATKHAAGRTASWPVAKAAFLKMSAGTNPQAGALIRQMPDESVKEMLDVVLEGMVSQEIPLEKCGTIDTYVRLLSPLPPQNTAELIALTVGLAADDGEKAKLGKISICPAGT